MIFSGFMFLFWWILEAMNSRLPNHAGQREVRVVTTRLWCVVTELRAECLFALFVKVVI